MRHLFFYLLFLLFFLCSHSCVTKEKALNQALDSIMIENEPQFDPYQDSVYVQLTKKRIAQFVEDQPFKKLAEIFERSDEQGKALILSQVDKQTEKQLQSDALPRGGPPKPIKLMPVYFGTDRKPKYSNSELEIFDNTASGDSLILGKCLVSIPPIHVLGELEEPDLMKLEFTKDKQKHICFDKIEIKSQEDFLKDLSHSDTKEAFVFIHGYNCPFDEAAFRTAQIAYDLGYPGTPIFYSWPSKGTLQGYFDDEKAVEASVRHLYRFIDMIANSREFDKVNIIAHSMGSRATAKALVEFGKEYNKKIFDHLVLAAPDINAEVFKKEIAPFIKKSAKNITLYSSSQDLALRISKALNSKPRVGQAGDDIVVIPGIQTVDASITSTDVLGHGYLYKSWILIQDVYELVVYNHLAEERCLDHKFIDIEKYWLLQNQMCNE